MNRATAILAFSSTLTACGPGCSDYSEQIGDTNYTIDGTDSRSHWIFPSPRCGNNCPSIKRDVLKFKSNEQVITARRQVVRDYKCDEPILESQYLAKYEQYVIILKSNKLIGPLTVAEYKDFAINNPALIAGIDLLNDTDTDGSGVPLTVISSCTNPRPA